MSRKFAEAPPAAVRALIARELLMEHGEVSTNLGEIVLRPYQQECAARLLEALRRDRGVLLADPVGIGKTFIALAVARLFAPVLVLVPASLRSMWVDASARAHCRATILTHEALSAGGCRRVSAALVIIDEAHRLRSTDARRYAAAADLCRGASVLLLTATPVQNRAADLRAELALFLGSEAWTCAEEHLASFVVRDVRSREEPAMPRLDGPHVVPLPPDDDLLDELLALPPALPAADEGTAPSLALYGLVHQWASSRAALRAALQRRRARGLALLSAVESGRAPTRSELTAWNAGDGTLQLAFPELVVASQTNDPPDLPEIASAIAGHLDATARLLSRLGRDDALDAARAAALRDIRTRHSSERIIAFAQYAETVAMLYRRLMPAGGVAMLTARGGRIASGPVTRRDVLDQFVGGSGAIDVPPDSVDRIDLLLATDLLSEGLNLQRASVIVHLDMPWNPARLDQRVGRARRLGARHDAVSVYFMAPPARANRLLDIERRLRGKLASARIVVGVAGRILPAMSTPELPVHASLAEQSSDLRSSLRSWLDETRDDASAVTPADAGSVAAVRSQVSGFLALARMDGAPALVCSVGDGLHTDVATLLRVVALASGEPAETHAHHVATATSSITQWMRSRGARSMLDLGALAAARARRLALARVDRALARTPRQRLPLVAPLARAARAVASARMGAGAERVLETLVHAELPDEAWLRAVAAFVEVNVETQPPPRHDDEIVALILLEPE